MQPTRNRTRLLTVATAVALAVCGRLPAVSGQDGEQASDAAFEIAAPRSTLEVTEKFSKVIRLDQKISRVDGFDPTVLGVTPLSPRELRLQALAQGVTTVVLKDETGATFTIEVFVTGDARLLQAILDRNFPDASISAIKVREAVLLRGWISQPEQIPRIVEIAEVYFPKVLNQIEVGGPQQVQLRVKVMEVQRSKMRQLGFNFIYANQHGFVGSTPGQLNPIDTILLPLTGGGPGVLTNIQPTANAVGQSGLTQPALSFGVLGDGAAFQGFLDALISEGLLKIMAEPTLVTTNGRPAKLLNGGEFPILVPQGVGTVSVDWREFGVRLESVPIIIGGNRLRQELTAEVSERDFSNAVEVSGLRVPGLTTRRVDTQVEMNFGQTLVIAGLISNRHTAETNKVPFLGELPYVGAAFRTVSYQEVETELLVLVTPEYVSPLEPHQVPLGPGQNSSAPTDRELFWHGVMEVPNYGDKCPTCGPNNPSGGSPLVPHPAGVPIYEGMPPGPALPVKGALEDADLIQPISATSDAPAFSGGKAPNGKPGNNANWTMPGGPSKAASSAADGGLIEPKSGLIAPSSQR